MSVAKYENIALEILRTGPGLDRKQVKRASQAPTSLLKEPPVVPVKTGFLSPNPSPAEFLLQGGAGSLGFQ